jgi:hypothetical protein
MTYVCTYVYTAKPEELDVTAAACQQHEGTNHSTTIFTVAATELCCPFVSSLLLKYKIKRTQSVAIARKQQKNQHIISRSF